MINIYIGLSINQVASYKEVLRFNNDESSKNVLITSRTLENDLSAWDEVICANETFNNQSSGKLSAINNILKKIKQYKQIIKQLLKYKKEKEITLYFTYIEDILTNHLLFSFNSNMKGVVVEDGTLNYYSHTIKSLSKKKVLLKWFLSYIYGIRFKLYKGHSSGIEHENVTHQYVRVPELSMFPEKSIKLPYPTRETNLSNTILIIGQEGYINQLGEKRYMKSLRDLVDLIKSKTFYETSEKLYYKPHRNGKRIDFKWLKKHFSNKEVILLEPDTPLEELYFDKLGSKYIFSFDSSALLNIYLETSDLQKEKLSFNVLMKYNNLLEPIFEKFKFNIYK
jgi:hypothetical protein